MACKISLVCLHMVGTLIFKLIITPHLIRLFSFVSFSTHHALCHGPFLPCSCSWDHFVSVFTQLNRCHSSVSLKPSGHFVTKWMTGEMQCCPLDGAKAQAVKWDGSKRLHLNQLHKYTVITPENVCLLLM